MKPLALSTMFAQQERFADGAAFARFAADSGYDAIEISHSTAAEKVEQIAAAALLPITSVHQPAPWQKLTDGRSNGHANLASCDEDERRLAVEEAKASISWARRLGATKLVVHLGQVTEGHGMFDEEFQMRRMFDSGRAGEPRYEELRAAAVTRRANTAEAHLAAARKSLEELVACAEPHGIAVGIENRYHFHEIPGPAEYEVLLDGFDVGQAGYWHDTGHAEVLHRLGFIDRGEWLGRWSGRCIGAHLHDVLGIGDHRTPGDGDVEWRYITDGVGHLDRYTLEINQHQPDELVAGAPAFLESIGLR